MCLKIFARSWKKIAFFVLFAMCIYATTNLEKEKQTLKSKESFEKQKRENWKVTTKSIRNVLKSSYLIVKNRPKSSTVRSSAKYQGIK